MAQKLKSMRKDGLRDDGWMNLLTGVGTQARDKRMSSRFAMGNVMTEQQLTAMYRDEGFSKRIVDLPADEMTREWITINGDEEGVITGRMEELFVQREINRTIKWSRLFGGAICVMGIDDGGKLEQPVNEAKIRNIRFIKVYDRYRLNWSSIDNYTDPNNEKFGTPQFYNVNPINGGLFRAHESRVLVCDGIDLPDMSRQLNNGWGDSALQAAFDKLRALGNVYSGIEHIVDDFVQGVLTITNLQELIASGKEALVKKRLDLIDLSRHTIHTTLLDEREKFEKHSSTVTGLPDLIDRFVQALSAATGIPVTLLMGQSPAGLNATGDSDIRNWYDKIAGEQEDKLAPMLEKLTRYMFLSKELFSGGEPEGWSIEFKPLWQLSEKEIADARYVQAQSDNLYITNGTLTPEEVAINRFGGDAYSYETVLQTERVVPTAEEQAEAEEEARQAEVELAAAQKPPAGGEEGAI